MTVLATNAQESTDRADWLLVFDSAMRVGNFASLDDLFLRALNAWLEQLSPALRWKIAVDLYSNEQVSLGRAAQIAGLNPFVLIQKLDEQGIPLVAPEPATEEELKKEETLLNELFDFNKK